MDARTFFGLQPRAGDPTRWTMEVVRGLTSGTGALFGGVGLGACIEVMERVTGRPCIWATAQFLSYARPLDLEGQWSTRPDVPSPADCEPRPMMNHHEGRISSRLDSRLADGRPFWEFPGPTGSGNAALWVRMPEVLEMSAAALAIIGDYVPFGIGQALGRRAGGNSLDNTLRVAHRVPTEWVLADVRVHAIADGFGHGLVHLWAEDGTLLGTGSQSTIVRTHRNEPPTELEGDMNRE